MLKQVCGFCVHWFLRMDMFRVPVGRFSIFELPSIPISNVHPFRFRMFDVWCCVLFIPNFDVRCSLFSTFRPFSISDDGCSKLCSFRCSILPPLRFPKLGVRFTGHSDVWSSFCLFRFSISMFGFRFDIPGMSSQDVSNKVGNRQGCTK